MYDAKLLIAVKQCLFATAAEEKKGFVLDMEKETKENTDFRRVLYTGEHTQLVLMSLNPNQDIGMESHDVDQFFRFEEGSGTVIINGTEHVVKEGSAVVIPAGAEHNVVAGEPGLKLYSLYSPPHHEDGVVRKTKEEAEDPENKEEFNGETTE